LRNPGMVTWEAMSRYAFRRLGSSSANGTSIASRTLVGLRVSTVLFTGVLLGDLRIPGARSSLGQSRQRARSARTAARESGWRDLNPRPPAPKESALPSRAPPRGVV